MNNESLVNEPESVVTWKNDTDLFPLIRSELFSAVVGDILDKLGYHHQFLPPRIQPVEAGMVVVGRAMTVLEADIANVTNSQHNPVLNRPFGLMLEALDSLKENDVYICSGSSSDYALWGELMSTRAMHLKAAGAVVNGYHRDTAGILGLKFPTFSAGRYAQDQAPRGKVIDFGIPITFGNVTIHPGDLVIGDLDGVCVVPQPVETEVIQLAFEKARGERVVFQKIQQGMSAKEAFDRYGIL